MRIFMLVQRPSARGPVPKLAAHLVAAMRAKGATVVTHHWGQRQHDEGLLAKVTERARDVLSVRRTLKEEGHAFDIAVVQTAHDWRTLLRDIVVVQVLRRHCGRIVLHLHGSFSSDLLGPGNSIFKLFTALLLRQVDALMVLSTEEQREWRAFRRHPPVFAVKNPFVGDPSRRGPAEPDRSGSIPRILFVGRLMREKGIFELLEAFAEVHRRSPSELVIVGEGERSSERKLRDRIRALGMADHVTLAGYLTGEALSDVYREASLFVLPSWSEGFPTVLAEAMDAGLPIVTTRIRGAADHLVADENALLVEPRDVTGLASAITTLLEDRDRRSRMGAANRERLRIFDPEVVADEYLRTLQLIVDEAPGDR